MRITALFSVFSWQLAELFLSLLPIKNLYYYQHLNNKEESIVLSPDGGGIRNCLCSAARHRRQPGLRGVKIWTLTTSPGSSSNKGRYVKQQKSARQLAG